MSENKDNCLEGNTCQRVFPIFEQYREELTRFVNRRISDPSQSEALVSDVLIKLHHNCEKLTEVKNIRAWMFQITRNTIYDYHRDQSKRAQSLPENNIVEDFYQTNEFLHLASLVPLLINCLPYKYSVPLQLSELEGLPQKDIAKRLNITLSGAKSRIQRGRRKLKELFHECLYLELDRQGVPIDYQIKPDCLALMSEVNKIAKLSNDQIASQGFCACKD